MKIEVLSLPNELLEQRRLQHDAELMQLILDGIGSLEGFTTDYKVIDGSKMPSWASDWLDDSFTQLPLTAVNGKVVKKQAFLTNEEVTHFTGVSFSLMNEAEYNDHEQHNHGSNCSCGHHH